MTTRDMTCPACGVREERTALQLNEPSTACSCGAEMKVHPSCQSWFKLMGAGFTRNDYPKSNEQLKKDYGFDKEDSTNPDSDYSRGKYGPQ